MSFKDRRKKQKCCHWARTGTDEYGKPTFAAPVELDCRWSGRSEKYTTATGEELVSRAVAFVDGVAVGDVLMLGTLDSGVDENNSLENDGAWEVKAYASTPNLRNTVTYYKAYL
jgi:hypothetical protein